MATQLPTPKKTKQVLATHLPATDIADATAVRAVADGTADADQQKRAMKWIIEKAAMTYDLAYFQTDRDTAFALGRVFVGQQIVGLLKLNTGALRRAT
jgi:hypothetical protein